MENSKVASMMLNISKENYGCSQAEETLALKFESRTYQGWKANRSRKEKQILESIIISAERTTYISQNLKSFQKTK